jgi:hypothetical protein
MTNSLQIEYVDVCRFYQFINKVTLWGRLVLEKLIAVQLINKFLVLYEARRLINLFTRARHWSAS